MMVALAELEKYFGGCLTMLTAQKLVYFLQVLGVEFGLKFSKQKFGPYSAALDNAFKAMEKNDYISGYTEIGQVRVIPAIYAASGEFLKSRHMDVADKLQKLSMLIDGYETPYGMELLASAHFLSVSEEVRTQPEMSKALASWNSHEHGYFPEAAVTAALGRLKDDGLIGIARLDSGQM